MTDNTHVRSVAAPRDTAGAVEKSLKRRCAADRRFRLYGVTAIGGALGFLFLLLGNIFYSGHTALWQTKISLDITFESADFIRDGVVDEASIAKANYHVRPSAQ